MGYRTCTFDPYDRTRFNFDRKAFAVFSFDRLGFCCSAGCNRSFVLPKRFIVHASVRVWRYTCGQPVGAHPFSSPRQRLCFYQCSDLTSSDRLPISRGFISGDLFKSWRMLSATLKQRVQFNAHFFTISKIIFCNFQISV